MLSSQLHADSAAGSWVFHRGGLYLLTWVLLFANSMFISLIPFWEFLFCFRMLVDVSWFMLLYPIVHRHWLHTYCTHIDCDDHPLCCLYTWQTFSNYYVYYIITYHHSYVCICGTILYIFIYNYVYIIPRWAVVTVTFTVTLRKTSGQQWSKAKKSISAFYKPSPNGRFIIGLPTLLVYHGIPLYLGWIEKDLSNFENLCFIGFSEKNAAVLELKELRNLTGWPHGKQQWGNPPKKDGLVKHDALYFLSLVDLGQWWLGLGSSWLLIWSYMNLYDLMLFQANDA